jgi:hypothetical protein
VYALWITVNVALGKTILQGKPFFLDNPSKIKENDWQKALTLYSSGVFCGISFVMKRDVSSKLYELTHKDGTTE